MADATVPSPAPGDAVEEADTFSPARARQMLAMLGRDPSALRTGDPLPRGWHAAMFAPAVPPSELRPDGFAGIGVALPPTDLTRLVFGGRRIGFEGDLRIGAPATRRTRLLSARERSGRSGRLMVVTVGRDVHDARGVRVVAEQQDYVLREAAPDRAHAEQADPGGAAPGAEGSEREGPGRDGPGRDGLGREGDAAGAPTAGGRPFVADAAMLFRYCALTFNTHRIHYDHPYATGVEGYPALVVNGNLSALMLLELFRERAGREPVEVTTRNVRPLFCGRANTLHVRSGHAGPGHAGPEHAGPGNAEPGNAGPGSAGPGEPWWRLWVEDEAGRVALEAEMR